MQKGLLSAEFARLRALYVEKFALDADAVIDFRLESRRSLWRVSARHAVGGASSESENLEDALFLLEDALASRPKGARFLTVEPAPQIDPRSDEDDTDPAIERRSLPPTFKACDG